MIAILPWWLKRVWFPLVLVDLDASASSRLAQLPQDSPGGVGPRPLDHPLSCLEALRETLQAAGVYEAVPAATSGHCMTAVIQEGRPDNMCEPTLSAGILHDVD